MVTTNGFLLHGNPGEASEKSTTPHFCNLLHDIVISKRLWAVEFYKSIVMYGERQECITCYIALTHFPDDVHEVLVRERVLLTLVKHMTNESEDPGVRVLCSEALGDAVKHCKLVLPIPSPVTNSLWS